MLFDLLQFFASMLSLTIAPTEDSPTVSGASISLNYSTTCNTIAKSISRASGVYYFGNSLYTKGNDHWASSSNQNSACVVEPANPQDVSTILRIVSNTSTPFGIRSGGHATNPGFSSTAGVQIALFKLSEVTYHPAPLAADGSVGTVDIGSGLVWDDVHAALQPHGVTVVGGRVTGVGVGGFILGGGYSWLSNQHGLGGFNNFGVVTKFTLLAFPQGQVWGGLKTFTANRLDRVNRATVAFINEVTDPKAGIIVAYNFLLGQPGVSLLMFYDGPTPPAGIFERFDAIPCFTCDVSTRNMTSLLQSSPANSTYGTRGAFHTISLKTYSPALIEQVLNQTKYWGEQLHSKSGVFISYDVEPFLPSMNSRSKGGAYPHDNYLVPLNLYYAWLSPAQDKEFVSSMQKSAEVIFNQAVAEGQDIAGAKQIKYANYAAANENLQSLYGENLPRLKEIKARYDPDNIMRLAGGYRF